MKVIAFLFVIAGNLFAQAQYETLITVAPTASAPADFVSDTFTDANGTDLTAHTGEVGATWAKVTGYTGAIQIVTNAAKGNAGGISMYYASGTPATAEYNITSDFNQISAVDEVALFGRGSSASNHCYRLYYAHAAGELRIELVTPTTTNSLASASITSGTMATVTNWAFQIRDASKKGFTNGVEALTTSDNTLTTAGVIGIFYVNSDWGINTTGRRLDNFKGTNP